MARGPRVTTCRTATLGRGRVQHRLLDASRTPGALVLPGLPASSGGAVLTALAVAAVLLSRLLLLPDGPWEQDEALFAAGVLDFDVTRHRPHPPGFPGWIAIGKLLLPLAGDPVLALQIASSLASAVLFWAMAQLLGRIVPGGRATLLAAAFTTAPLVWVHAGRAFSTTPALACAAVAVLGWSRGRRAHCAGWLALALAALVRPQLAPELAVLALAGLCTPDVPRSTKMQGLVLAGTVGLLGAAFVLLGTPGAWAAFADHLGRHTGGLDRALPWSALGFVRGLVHPGLAAVVVAGVALGLVLAVRSDRRRGAWLVLLFAVTAWMILRHHHPGFPRYGVALLAAAMPALAWALTPLPRRLAFILTGLATIVGTAASVGTLLWMHAAPLPVVAAARFATSDPETTALAYSHGVFSFVRLEAERSGVPGLDVLDPAAPLTLPPHAYAIEGRTLHAMDGVTACALDLDPAPAQAMTLGQGRFGRARLVRDPVVLGDGFHAPEHDERGDRFAWMALSGTLHLPTEATVLQLRIEVPDDVAGARLVVDGRTHPLVAGPMALAVPVSGARVVLSVDRRHEADGDPRALSLRLDAAWVEGPTYAPSYGHWSPGLPRSVRAHDVELQGFETPELFAHERRGAWTRGDAEASFPARPGTLSIRLARPAHTPGDVLLETDAEQRRVHVDPAITTVQLRTEAPGGRAVLGLHTPTFVPAQVREGSEDTRALGLIVYDVAFLPDGDRCRPDGVSSPPR